MKRIFSRPPPWRATLLVVFWILVLVVLGVILLLFFGVKPAS